MAKLAKFISAIYQIIKKPYLLNLVLDEENKWKAYVSKKYKLSCGLPLVDISYLFPDFNETVDPYAYLDGATLPIDIALLKALSKKNNVKSYFEIGTWRGESVANVSSIVTDCKSFNLSDNDLFDLGKDENYVGMHRFFSDKIENVEHLYGNSQDFDFSNYYGKFDMVFIDGDHHYKSVKNDTKTAFKLLKDDNGIIVWHDYAYESETVRWSVLAAILDSVPEDKRKNIYHISNTLCAVYINEDLITKELKANDKPNHWFEVNIKVKRS